MYTPESANCNCVNLFNAYQLQVSALRLNILKADIYIHILNLVVFPPRGNDQWTVTSQMSDALVPRLWLYYITVTNQICYWHSLIPDIE